MDDSLARLRRDVEANPGDQEAARRYEAALLRAGKREEVQALYRFKFQCPREWSTLQARFGADESRYCDTCERSVYWVRNADELESRIRSGDCVACQPAVIGPALDTMIDDPSAGSARSERGPCLLEHDGPQPVPVPMPVPVQLTGRPQLIHRGFFSRIWKGIFG